jgi:hypothetical protein
MGELLYEDAVPSSLASNLIPVDTWNVAAASAWSSQHATVAILLRVSGTHESRDTWIVSRFQATVCMRTRGINDRLSG